jgi:Zn-dependent protease
MEELFPPLHWTNLLVIPGLLVGFTVHELGHALAAYFLGDYSQVEEGKITLNPLRHISWFGALSFLLVGVGWPKPLQVNPQHFRQGHLGLFIVALCGPAANFTFFLIGFMVTLSTAALLVYTGGVTSDEALALLFPAQVNLPQTLNLQAWAMAFTSHMAIVSFWLTFISLLPLPGLDGFIAVISLVTFLREWREEQALALPPAAAQISPESPQQKRRSSAADIHFKLGAEYHQANQYQDAVARYRQAIKNDQQFGPAYVNLGLAYLGLGKRKEAIGAFRGAVQYAEDKKSQLEAWQQLHRLSEVSTTDAARAQAGMAELGATPWTDTKPRPSWLTLGIVGGLLLVAGAALYGYLVVQLLKQLA